MQHDPVPWLTRFGLRHTQARRAVLRHLLKVSPGVCSTRETYAALGQDGVRLSYSMVFRIMRDFHRCGLVESCTVAKGETVYRVIWLSTAAGVIALQSVHQFDVNCNHSHSKGVEAP